MRFLIPFATAVVFLAIPLAWAKPKGCFSQAEISSDLVVRHGVFLREASRRCESKVKGTNQLWTDFDKAFGDKLRSERTRRESAFKREFPEEWLKVVTTFDARMVTFERNYYNTPEFCEDIKSQLDDNQKSGWRTFVKQSKTDKDAANLDIRHCD